MSDPKSCIVCEELMCAVRRLNDEEYLFDCPTCGQYTITRYDLLTGGDWQSLLAQDWSKRALLAFSIHKRREEDVAVVLDSGWIENVLDGRLPSHAELVEKLLLWMGENSAPGGLWSIDSSTGWVRFGAAGWDAFEWLLHQLHDEGVISIVGQARGGYREFLEGRLTLEGWKQHDKVAREGISRSRRAFMAMPFVDAAKDDYSVNRAYVEFKRAVVATGFNLERVDESAEAGSIPEKIKVDILTSKFVVAELTGGNPGVYFEAGFADGRGKPVIYTCSKEFFDKKGTHFDIKHHLHVLWEPSGLQEAREDLKNIIRATLPGDARLED